MACAAGFALTVAPLVQTGEDLGTALWDAVLFEMSRITIIEVVVIGVDLLLARNAGPVFRSSLIVALTRGLVAAWPVSVALVRYEAKEGVMEPRQTGRAAG